MYDEFNFTIQQYNKFSLTRIYKTKRQIDTETFNFSAQKMLSIIEVVRADDFMYCLGIEFKR